VIPITTLLWDVGGVLASNGWDRYARASAVEHFSLDAAEFEARHQEAVADFETGRMSLRAYVGRVIFHRPRTFTTEAFIDFMLSCSQPFEDALAVARTVSASQRYLMAALNNESREINDYRIARFGLGDIFSLFFSSGYVGLRKPDPAIYRLALDVTRKAPAECLVIDDRPENIAAAVDLGMPVLHHLGDAAELKTRLGQAGIVTS
jgi:putative hydrolase of the HAD superfamily